MCNRIAIMRFFGIMLLLLGMTLGLYGFAAAAGDEAPSEEETLFLDLVNQARTHPLEAAASLGIDTDQLLEDLPEIRDILIHGLPPLTWNHRLHAAASSHAEDMLIRNYFSKQTPEGITPQERMRSAEYPVGLFGETIGMVAFNNLMGPDAAVHILYERMFRAELAADCPEPRHILNPDLCDVGIAIREGAYRQLNALTNAYMVTADFAKPFDLYAVERGLWRLINDARTYPRKALEDAGIDEETACKALGPHAWVLDAGLPPLAWNGALHLTAVRHGEDMLARSYYGTITPEGLTVADRIQSAGYHALYAGEGLGWVQWIKVSETSACDPIEMARQLFAAMLKEELDPDSGVQPDMLSPEPTELGIYAMRLPVNPEDPASGCVFTTVCDYACPEEPRIFLMGSVYQDLNKNGFFNLYEGIEGLTVRIGTFGGEDHVLAATGPLGEYQLPLPSGFAFLELLVTDPSGNTLDKGILFGDNWNRLRDPAVSLPTAAVTGEGLEEAGVLSLPWSIQW